MNKILSGLDGVLCLIDDTIVFGQTKEEHDLRLKAALERVQRAGVTLNKEKCEFGKEKLTFLGHLVDSQGIQADPEKTKAVREMNQPENVSELRRFLGMVNQMGKFIINLAELTQPLRELLKKNMKWQWNIPQEEAFIKIKEELCKSTVLSFYDPNLPTKVSADTSSYGLGAVLLQLHNSQWKPVAYASRSMSDGKERFKD